MKKTLCLSLILTLALFLSSSTAFAEFKGTFEAPFLLFDGGNVVLDEDGNVVQVGEGKLNTNGDYKVEIETGEADVTYEVCIHYGVTATEWLKDKTTDEDGELKADGNILTELGVNYLQAPSFQVRLDSANDDCSGTLVYESGLGLVFGESEDVGPPEGKGPPEDRGPK